MPTEQRNGFVEGVRQRVSKLAGRVSWPLGPDGRKLAKENLQDKTRQQIQDVIRATMADPELVAALGLGDVAPPAAKASALGDLNTLDLAKIALEAVSRASVHFAKRRYIERIAELAGLTYDERQAIAPLLAKVLDKYLPDTLGKYADEIALAAAIVAVGAGKIRLMREADARERANPVEPVAA
jgi:hypothetical protein